MTINSFRIRESKRIFEEREREALERKLAPIKQATEATLRQLREVVDKKVQQQYGGDATQVMEETDSNDPSSFDDSFDAPLRPEGEPFSTTGDRAGFKEFTKILKSKYGYTLKDSRRLTTYSLVHSLRGFDFTLPETWQAAFDRLQSLDLFNPDELSFNANDIMDAEPAPTPEPTPEVTLDDLLSGRTDTTTREGEKLAKKVLEREYFAGEGRAVWGEWIDSLARNFNYVPPEIVKKKAFELFQRRNFSFLDRKAYDQVRLSLVRAGVMPSSCLTPDDALGFEIEDSPLASREQRQEFAKKQRQIHGQKFVAS